MNLMFIPSFALFFLLDKAGRDIAAKLRTPSAWILPIFIGLLLSVPGALLFLYYFHIFDKAEWYYEFRTWRGAEMTGAGMGFLAGILYARFHKSRILRLFVLLCFAFILIVPFIKLFLAPFSWQFYEDRWKDGACMQTTSSSCGACSAATLLRDAGYSVTEKSVAKESYTYVRGTEIWYLARAFKRRGFDVDYMFLDGARVKSAPAPAIAGVLVGNWPSKFGHFIAINEKRGDVYVVSDPLDGKHRFTSDELFDKYEFTGFFMKVSKKRHPHNNR